MVFFQPWSDKAPWTLIRYSGGCPSGPGLYREGSGDPWARGGTGGRCPRTAAATAAFPGTSGRLPAPPERCPPYRTAPGSPPPFLRPAAGTPVPPEGSPGTREGSRLPAPSRGAGVRRGSRWPLNCRRHRLTATAVCSDGGRCRESCPGGEGTALTRCHKVPKPHKTVFSEPKKKT